jgi:hypothetical protein
LSAIDRCLSKGMAGDTFDDLAGLAKAARVAQFALGLASMGVSGSVPRNYNRRNNTRGQAHEAVPTERNRETYGNKTFRR